MTATTDAFATKGSQALLAQEFWTVSYELCFSSHIAWLSLGRREFPTIFTNEGHKGVRNHETFFCPHCGRIWGRKVVAPLLHWPTSSWRVTTRPCSVHPEGGSLLTDEDFSIIETLTEEAPLLAIYELYNFNRPFLNPWSVFYAARHTARVLGAKKSIDEPNSDWKQGDQGARTTYIIPYAHSSAKHSSDGECGDRKDP